MDKLIAGYRRFRAHHWKGLRDLAAKFAEGQRPRLLVIACCDSRVDPATIFDANPGELFVIRNIANLVPPFEATAGYHGTSAAIEFAVEILQVQTILVMGHAHCGGVQAALENKEPHPGSFLYTWVGLLDAAKDRVTHDHDKDPARALEHESIKVSLENLMSFPFIADRVNDGRLKLAGTHYGVADGKLEMFDPKANAFVALD
jgi:carbonic anhydrase